MAGPLSFMSNQDPEPPRLESSFVPMSVAMPQSASERLSQIKEEVAPDEAPSIADTIKEARMRLLNQATGGVHPFVAYLTAKSRGGVDKYANAADAMNQAYAQRDASEQAKNLKLLDYSIKEGEARASEAKNKADEAYRTGMLKVEQDKLGIVGAESPAGKQALDEGYKPGTPAFAKRVKEIAAAAAEKNTGPKMKGFDVSGNPVTDENITDLYYSPATFGKTKAALKGTIDGISAAKKTLDLIDENPDAFSNWRTAQAGLPPQLQSIVPDNWNKLTKSQREIRARVFNQAAAYIKNLYGVAVSGREKEMLRTFLPTTDDNLDSLIGKLQSAYKISLEGIGNADSEMLKKAGSNNLDYVLELSANPYGKKEKSIPQMTEDEVENKRVYDSLNKGDEFRTLNGTLKRKGDV